MSQAVAERAVFAKKTWRIRKYANDQAYAEGRHFAESVFHDNQLLNEGITEALKLICGISATAFSNAAAQLGVGDSATAAAANQTGLQGGSKAYVAMEATYPQVSGSVATFRGVYTSAVANFAWNEFSVANGATEATDENLNRKVSAQGTKASGQTWTLDLQITLS
jgi:hypothetical protein